MPSFLDFCTNQKGCLKMFFQWNVTKIWGEIDTVSNIPSHVKEFLVANKSFSYFSNSQALGIPWVKFDPLCSSLENHHNLSTET